MLVPPISAFLILIALFFSFQNKDLPQPANFKIKGSVLIISDKEDKELWQKEINQVKLATEETYRTRFQSKTRDKEDHVIFPNIIIKDINKDNYAEVLFSIQTQDEFNEGRLICYSHDGRELWTFEVGGRIQIGSDIFSAPFRIKGFITFDYDADGSEEIFVIGIHRPHYPCQLSVLNSRGKKIAEYWHAGYISDLEFYDIDDDDLAELLVSGQNEEYKKGFFCGFEK